MKVGLPQTKSKLILENKHATNSKWRYISITQNTDAIDFDVETTITLDKTPNEFATYGLVWGMYNDNSDYRVVQLSANKQLQIYHYYKLRNDMDRELEIDLFLCLIL